MLGEKSADRDVSYGPSREELGQSHAGGGSVTGTGSSRPPSGDTEDKGNNTKSQGPEGKQSSQDDNLGVIADIRDGGSDSDAIFVAPIDGSYASFIPMDLDAANKNPYPTPSSMATPNNET